MRARTKQVIRLAKSCGIHVEIHFVKMHDQHQIAAMEEGRWYCRFLDHQCHVHEKVFGERFSAFAWSSPDMAFWKNVDNMRNCLSENPRFDGHESLVYGPFLRFLAELDCAKLQKQTPPSTAVSSHRI